MVASKKSPEFCVFQKNSYHRIWRKLFLWKGFPEMDVNWLQCIVYSMLLYRGLNLSNFVLRKHKSWSWLNCFTFMNGCSYFSPQYHQVFQYSCNNLLFVYICSHDVKSICTQNSSQNWLFENFWKSNLFWVSDISTKFGYLTL